MFDLNIILWWSGIGLVCLILMIYLFISSRPTTSSQRNLGSSQTIAELDPSFRWDDKKNDDVSEKIVENGFITADASIQDNLLESPEDLEPLNFPGEDPIASQLDLARAYIDMGKLPLARKILEPISNNEKFNSPLRNLAKILLSECAVRETQGTV
jgi:FimV-like protein